MNALFSITQIVGFEIDEKAFWFGLDESLVCSLDHGFPTTSGYKICPFDGKVLNPRKRVPTQLMTDLALLHKASPEETWDDLKTKTLAEDMLSVTSIRRSDDSVFVFGKRLAKIRVDSEYTGQNLVSFSNETLAKVFAVMEAFKNKYGDPSKQVQLYTVYQWNY